MEKKSMVNFSFLIVIALSVVCDGVASDSPDGNAIAEILLSDIRDNLLVLEQLDQGEKSEDEVTSIVVDSAIRKILLLRSTSYEIAELRGRALETLCLLSEPEAMEWLEQTAEMQLARFAKSYVEGVEVETRSRIEKIQRTMRGSGCYLTPQ